MYGERNGPRWRELRAERIANAEQARLRNLDWRARVAERERDLRMKGIGHETCTAAAVAEGPALHSKPDIH